MKKSLLLSILLGLLLISAAAADPGDTLWTRTYGGSDDDIGYSVQQTSDGGYFVAGYTGVYPQYDFYLVKTDRDGDTLWTRTYGGGDYDKAHCGVQTSDGGYMVAGGTQSYGAGDWDVYLVKTDANGDSLWTRTYGGDKWDWARSIQQTSDGGYIIAGLTQSFGAGWNDVWILKTDANGDTLWTRTCGGSDQDYGAFVLQTSDGGYIVAGYTNSFGAGSWDAYLLKADADGTILWTRTYGGTSYDYAYCVQQTSDGGYIISGLTASFGAGDWDVYLVKTDANGDSLWTRTCGQEGRDYAYAGQETPDGGYIIAGATKSFGAGDYDLYVVKTDANGDSLWTRAYGGELPDQAYFMQQTEDGNYIITGYTDSFGAGSDDVWLVKVVGEAEEPAVSIEIVPDHPPVTVPQGGRFGFTGTLTNNTEDPQVSDAWTMAIGPQKETYGPFKMRNDVELDPYQTRSAYFNQHVPNLAPLGFYSYIAYCGDYPSTAIDSSFFQVEVIAGASGGGEDIGWVLTGSFLEGEFTDLPSEFALLSNYPNPFNATTVISYQLPVSSSVKLEVYNILGNKVATLIDGEQEAGYRSVTWDASEVSSGIYFYKLSAGGFLDTNRMILLK